MIVTMRSFLCGIVVTSFFWIIGIYFLFPSDIWMDSGKFPTNEKELHLKQSVLIKNSLRQNHLLLNNRNNFVDFVSDSDALRYKLSYFFNIYQNDGRIFVSLIESSNSQLQNKKLSEKQHKENSEKLGKATTKREKFIRQDGYKRYQFNVLASNQIGLIRPLPDTRHRLCQGNHHSTTLNKTSDISKISVSIIICYYNEAVSVLVRTIASALERSDEMIENISEIIVVDDYSDSAYTPNNVSDFLDLPIIKFLRMPERAGLIRARLFGSRHAKGDILVFLDSHVEANVNWLRPLVEHIQSGEGTNSTIIACPMIDIINPNTFIYSSSPMVRGGTNWGLQFKWDSIPSDLLATELDFIKPILSPTMAGGLFAIRRDDFLRQGEYDPGMDIWGGENIELSLRTWMCGGRIDIIPCSRLGHVFRRRRPYGASSFLGDDTFIRNSLRVANVWLDNYIEYFYRFHPGSRQLDYGDINDRLELRQRLNCHNFTWYLLNVYPKLYQEALNANKASKIDQQDIEEQESINLFHFKKSKNKST